MGFRLLCFRRPPTVSRNSSHFDRAVLTNRILAKQTFAQLQRTGALSRALAVRKWLATAPAAKVCSSSCDRGMDPHYAARSNDFARGALSALR